MKVFLFGLGLATCMFLQWHWTLAILAMIMVLNYISSYEVQETQAVEKPPVVPLESNLTIIERGPVVGRYMDSDINDFLIVEIVMGKEKQKYKGTFVDVCDIDNPPTPKHLNLIFPPGLVFDLEKI